MKHDRLVAMIFTWVLFGLGVVFFILELHFITLIILFLATSLLRDAVRVLDK